MSELKGEAKTCAVEKFKEWTSQYIKTLGDGSPDEMISQPSDNIQMSLYKAGFDIWWDGNRGTKYQREYDDTEVENYWDFDVVQMGLNDQPAQIEYVLEQTGAKKLDYIGYSMGTMQMYALLGSAAEDPKLQATLNKVDKFLSMTACPWAISPAGEGAPIETRRAVAEGTAAMFGGSGYEYFFGEGADLEAQGEIMTAGMNDDVKRFF